ncbi:MAG TPA: hypothetical protein VK195_14440 [Burkholderiaceae bacterium]|nr:hypothetical protein [Burkholderiaceae bacterium]
MQAWTGSPGMLARRPGHVRPITPKLGPLPARGGLYTVCLSSLAEAADT